MNEPGKMPFTAHLEELRKRLIVCFIAVGVGFVLAYAVKEWLFNRLAEPLMKVMPQGEKLVYTGLIDPFFAYLKVSFFCGVLLALPVIMYQAWKFVSPGLYPSERKFLIPLATLSCLFFAAGMAFAYFVVFPFGFRFFMGYSSETLRALPSLREYLSLVTMMLLVFGTIFQLPLFITVLARFGLVSAGFLKKNRKYALIILLTVAAILTPPDVFSQMLMAVPLLVLYEISILGAMMFGKKPAKKEKPDPQAGEGGAPPPVKPEQSQA